jgi:hypothetical protein
MLRLKALIRIERPDSSANGPAICVGKEAFGGQGPIELEGYDLEGEVSIPFELEARC